MVANIVRKHCMNIVYKTRTQLVVETLREKILSGEFKAGESLRQAALATELNVSRIPVREALLQLEGEGLVVFEPHKGATVTELNAKHVDELFELRAMLESNLLAASLPLTNRREVRLKQVIFLLNLIKRLVLKMRRILGVSLTLIIITVYIQQLTVLKLKI